MGKRNPQKSKASIKFEDYLHENLKDVKEAAAYLKAASEDDMPEVLLLAMRDVAEAHGITSLSEETHINRESIYKTLSKKGNPTLRNLMLLLKGLNLRLSFEPYAGARPLNKKAVQEKLGSRILGSSKEEERSPKVVTPRTYPSRPLARVAKKAASRA